MLIDTCLTVEQIFAVMVQQQLSVEYLAHALTYIIEGYDFVVWFWNPEHQAYCPINGGLA